jgi:Ca2+-binding RTX toxin-like protein
MTWHLPQSGDTVTLLNGDDVFIAPQVFIDQSIAGPGTGHQIIVAGTLASTSTAITLGTDGGIVTVESTGQIRNFGGAAINFAAGGQQLVDHGQIRTAEFVTADRAVVVNVAANANTTRIENTGTVFGDDTAIATFSSVTVAVATVILENSGTIEARGFNGQFAHRSYMNESGALRDLITNTGLMIGDIELGGGNDLYDGRLGTVQGRVFGGDGDDTISGGAANDEIDGGADADNLGGGEGSDLLNGGLGIDTLRGGKGNDILNGSAGDDALTGGPGSDVFRFSTALGTSNVDTVTDFQINLDEIQLENAIFVALGASLTASEFVANATGAAKNGSQHILYDTTDGRLFFDADGNGGQARVHFATLTAGLALDHLDFLVT